MYINTKVYTITPLFDRKQYRAVYLVYYKDLYSVEYKDVFVTDCGKVFSSTIVDTDTEITI